MLAWIGRDTVRARVFRIARHPSRQEHLPGDDLVGALCGLTEQWYVHNDQRFFIEATRRAVFNVTQDYQAKCYKAKGHIRSQARVHRRPREPMST